MGPLISIIMPTFNNAKLIIKVIQSIRGQCHQNWELIIIDNFSSDDTENIVNKYNDQRIIYRKFSNEGVISRSRNEGIKIAKGWAIAFLDSDDWWKSNKLTTCIKALKDGSDLVYHKLKVVKDKGCSLSSIGKNFENDCIYESLLNEGNLIPNSSVIVLKELIDIVGPISEDPYRVTWEDFDYWVKISKISNKFRFIDQSLGYYFIGANNNTNPKATFKNVQNIKSILFSNSKYPRWLEYQEAVSLKQLGMKSNAIKKFKDLVSQNIFDKIAFKSFLYYLYLRASIIFR